MSSTITSLPTANTIDPVQDWLAIDTKSLNTTQKINRNTLLGLASAPVGLTDSQTLTNKILTSPTISGPTLSGTITGTYTIGGTPTFPSSVVTLTGSQTLTNKVLTSPTINTPTITNATISADTLSGYTTSNNGTVYGISVTGGQITSGSALANGIIGSSQIATNGIAASNLATSAITLGYAQITSPFTGTATSFADITSLTVTVTIPTGGRRIKITAAPQWMNSSSVAGTGIDVDIYDVTAGTEIGGTTYSNPVTSYAVNGFMCTTHVPSAGSRTYKLRYRQAAAGTFTYQATATIPAFILVEAI